MAWPSNHTFNDDFCERLINSMSEGKCLHEFLLAERMDWHTFDAWRKKHPKLKEAYNYGMHLELGWWKMKGRTNIENGSFNTPLYKHQLHNRFSHYFSDKGSRIQIDELKDSIEKQESPYQQTQSVIQGMSKGKISGDEALMAIKAIHSSMETKKLDEMDDAVTEIKEQWSKNDK